MTSQDCLFYSTNSPKHEDSSFIVIKDKKGSKSSHLRSWNLQFISYSVCFVCFPISFHSMRCSLLKRTGCLEAEFLPYFISKYLFLLQKVTAQFSAVNTPWFVQLCVCSLRHFPRRAVNCHQAEGTRSSESHRLELLNPLLEEENSSSYTSVAQ